MYPSHNPHLGDWKKVLKKVRKAVHSLAPRELSPTRMLEKYGEDTKKKNAAKLAKQQAASAAHNAAANAAFSQQVAQLQTAAPRDAGISEPPAGASIPEGSDKTDWTSYGLLAALLLGGILIYQRKKR